MAKFISTRKAVSEIEELIKNANEKLVLISPYLKLSNDFKELLSYRNSKDKITTIIFGKQELNPNEMTFLQGLRFVILKYNEHLHAKCYLNENKMIITSLNLYEFSMANNKEMGVLIDKNDAGDLQLYEDAMREVEYIDSISQRFDIATPKPKTSTTSYKPQNTLKSVGNKNGYCIRTGVTIPFDVERPLSYDAFQVWNQFGDPEYPERFCHFSGESSKGDTCVIRPILKKNWQKAKQAFSL